MMVHTLWHSRCCYDHDICYERCGAAVHTCDDTFRTCLEADCNAIINDADAVHQCRAEAAVFLAGIALQGCEAFQATQELACVCDEEDFSSHPIPAQTAAAMMAPVPTTNVCTQSSSTDTLQSTNLNTVECLDLAKVQWEIHAASASDGRLGVESTRARWLAMFLSLCEHLFPLLLPPSALSLLAAQNIDWVLLTSGDMTEEDYRLLPITRGDAIRIKAHARRHVSGDA